MPTPIGHALGAYAAMVALEPGLISDRRKASVTAGAAFVIGSLADADFLVAYFTRAEFLHHHYFSHSIPFALGLAALTFLICKILRINRPEKIAALVAAGYGSHLVLDYFAHDGSFPYGIPLLWPFTDKHFIAPVEIFLSIQRGAFEKLLGLHNLAAIGIEIAVLLPLAVVAHIRAKGLNAKTQRRQGAKCF